MAEYTFNLNEEDGRYYANIYDPSDRWRTRLSLLTTQKTVARQRLAEWERMAARGEWDPREGRPRKPGRLPLEQAVTQFMASYREEVREVTARNMTSALSQLKETIGADTWISHIRPGQVQGHIQDLTAHGSNAPAGSAAMSTKAQQYSYINRFFSWLHEQGLLDRDIMQDLERPKVDDAAQTYEVLSPSDANRLLRTCITEEEPRWWHQFVEVALSSGLRLSELHHLTWDRVDQDMLAGMSLPPDRGDFCELRVEPFVLPDGTEWRPKNRYSTRTVPAYPRGAAVLRRRWEAQDRPHDGWVWEAQFGYYEGRRPPQDRFQALMRKLGRVARLRPKRRVTIHDCRHTWFSWLLNDLGLAAKAPSISKMGGHGQIEQTWGYVTASNEAGREALHESVGLSTPSGREEGVRDFLTSAPIRQQTEEPETAPTGG